MTCENCTQLRAELAQAKEKNLFLQTQVWDLDALCADLKAALATEKAARERAEARVKELLAVENRELRAELAAQGDIVAQLHKDLVNANAAIARMKAGHDEIIEARTALRLIPLHARVKKLEDLISGRNRPVVVLPPTR